MSKRRIAKKFTILPETQSINWFYVFFISWLINLCAIILSRYLNNYNFDFIGNCSYAWIAFYAALLSCVGWFGFKVFTRTFMLFNAFALTYLLAIVITNANDGWSDLTSIVGHIFILLLGTVIATTLQLIVLIIKKINKKRSR